MSQGSTYRQFGIRRDKRRLTQALRAEANRLEREANQMSDALGALRQRDRRPADIAVTDHALIRFLERVMGIDVEAIRDQIARLVPIGGLPEATPELPDRHGILLVEDFQFLVTPTSLVTVLTEDMSPDCWLGLTSRDEVLAQ